MSPLKTLRMDNDRGGAPGAWRRFPRFSRRLMIVAMGLACAATPTLAAKRNFTDVQYGPDTGQVLDLTLPDGGSGPVPVVVYLHGGAFVGGDKHPCVPNFAAKLLAHNIAMACVNYRLAPHVTYPVPMLDAARAVQWLRAHHEDYNLAPARIALMGISAGGGIALWIAFHDDLADPSSSDPVLRQSSKVVAVVTSNAQSTYDPATIAAELHTQRYPKFLADLFGSGSIEGLNDGRFKAAEQDASPISHIHAGEPPLLAYYTSDAGASDLAPDSPPDDYIHHPIHGAILQKVAEQKGAKVTIHAGHFYPQGWTGFLDDAAVFLAAAFKP